MKVREYMDLLPPDAEVEITDADGSILAHGTAEDVDKQWDCYEIGAIVPGIYWGRPRIVCPITTIKI